MWHLPQAGPAAVLSSESDIIAALAFPDKDVLMSATCGGTVHWWRMGKTMSQCSGLTLNPPLVPWPVACLVLAVLAVSLLVNFFSLNKGMQSHVLARGAYLETAVTLASLGYGLCLASLANASPRNEPSPFLMFGVLTIALLAAYYTVARSNILLPPLMAKPRVISMIHVFSCAVLGLVNGLNFIVLFELIVHP
jgi:hypothetical protein